MTVESKGFVLTLPRAADGLIEEAAFKAMGFDPAEKQMPAVIEDWVQLYRNARAVNSPITPAVNSGQSKWATGEESTLSFRQRAAEISQRGGLLGALGSLGVALDGGKTFVLNKVPFKKILVGVAIGAGVIGLILVLRSGTKLVSAVKE